MLGPEVLAWRSPYPCTPERTRGSCVEIPIPVHARASD